MTRIKLDQHIAFTQITIEPQFHDLDPLNIVWHGHYVKYLEVVRCQLMQTIGYDIPQMQNSHYAWPVVDMRLKYIQPARYAQPIVVSAAIIEWEHRLKIHYEMHDAQTLRLINRAYTIQVALDMRTEQMCYQIPDFFQQLVTARAS